ncbi:hypothetical protein O6H91_Y033400 [Diphasiastrum complanatum]|nr:hypothetical protein O6H91_Y033400 [Diphasiastrum complanatum]
MGSAKVVVGVANDRSSKGALKWTLKNLDSDVITLLHICPPVRTIPTPMGKQVQIEEVSQEIVAAYLRDVKSKIDEFLLAYKRICESYKVVVECVIVENDSVEKGLLDYVSRYRIRKLVLGTSRLNAVTWKLMRPGLSVRVSKEAPAFCDVLLISKHRLHLVKDAKFHSSLSKSKSSASDVSNALVATSLYHHSLSSPSQGEIEVHSKARWFEQATAKLSKTWDSSSQLLSLQKRHATTLLNRLDDSALAPDANFTGSNENQLFISPLGSSRLWNIGQRPRESTTTRDFLEEDLQSYLSDLRSEDLHEDSESQLSPFSCCSQATGIDQSLWKHSDSTASQGVHSSCQQCSRGQVLHPHHHKLKVHEDFSTATRSCSDWSFISHRKSHVQSNQKLYLLSEKEGSQEPANKAMLLSHDSPSSTPMGMPSRLSPETYEEKVEMLREQLDQALHLAEKARKDADIQTMYRIKAEKAAIWAAEKAEEFAAKRLEEAKKRGEALKAADIARELATEESRKLDKALAAAQLARQAARLEAQLRKAAETRYLEETEARKAAIEALQLAQQKFREYDYEELKVATDNFSDDLKLGEGGYGIVYKGKLHHMTVAIKVLKEDGFQGPQEFQREVY